MFRKNPDIERKQREMDEWAKTFNKNMLELPSLIKPYTDATGQAMLEENITWLRAAIRVDYDLIIKRAMKYQWFDRYHEAILSADIDNFLGLDVDAELRVNRVPDRNRDYYRDLIGSMCDAWPKIPEDVREKIWFHVGEFYLAYQKYVSCH